MDFFNKKNKDKKLVLACKIGNEVKIKKYLDTKYTTNINYTSKKSGDTPLHKAVKYRKAGTCDLLLATQSVSVNVQNKNEESPLFLVIHKQAPNMNTMAESLIKAGASVRLPNKAQQMPLHLASQKGNKELVQMFIASGAEVDASDKDDNTALHFACENGFAEVVEELLIANAQSLANKAGLTPVQLASEKGHHHVLAVFDKVAANKSNIALVTSETPEPAVTSE